MRTLRTTLLLSALALLLVAPVRAQEGYLRGTYVLAMTINGTRYKLPVSAYRIASVVEKNETVPVLNILVTAAGMKGAGLPRAFAANSKLGSKTRFFQQVAGGQYQQVTMSDVMVSSIAATGNDGTTAGGSADYLLIQLKLGGQDLGIISPRDPASGLPTGYRAFQFPGRTMDVSTEWENGN